MKNKLTLIFLTALIAIQLINAVDFDDDISSSDKRAFDEMLEPVMKIYNFIKYVSTAISVIVLLIAGLTCIVGGGNPARIENAKNIAMYVVIGLAVIWAAPLIVEFIFS